jgi:hypothetical protein
LRLLQYLHARREKVLEQHVLASTGRLDSDGDLEFVAAPRHTVELLTYHLPVSILVLPVHEPGVYARLTSIPFSWALIGLSVEP